MMHSENERRVSFWETGAKAAVYRLFDFGSQLFDICFRMTKVEPMVLNKRVLAYAKASSNIVIKSDSERR